MILHVVIGALVVVVLLGHGFAGTPESAANTIDMLQRRADRRSRKEAQ